MKKVLLAFSGGLDTTYCLVYLQEIGYEVSTITVDTGGFLLGDSKKIENWAKELGSKKHFHVNASEALFNKYISPLIQANYLRNGTYPPCVGPERAIIVDEIAKIANDFDIIAHGSTGAGGDQIRFESSLYTILPGKQILAPIREKSLSRAETYVYLNAHNIKLNSGNKDYSINYGLIGNTIGGKETLDTKAVLPNNAFPNYVESPKNTHVKIEFFEGNPIAINDKKVNGVEALLELNKIGNECGFGAGYHIGTSIMGLKARLGFEAPGYKILVFCHSELEKIILTSKQIFWKNHLGNVYGDMVHEGHFYEPLLDDITAFIKSANKYVSGIVEFSIINRQIKIESMTSEYSMFNKKAGTYGETMSAWGADDAKAFAKLYSFEARNAYQTRSKK